MDFLHDNDTYREGLHYVEPFVGNPMKPMQLLLSPREYNMGLFGT